MAQNNDETKGAIMILAFIGALAWMMFLIVYALAAFLALLLTVLCICAWNRPVTIFGITTEPEEARQFVLRGVMGAGLVPMFAGFASILFDVPLRSDLTIHLFIVGYTLGSVGIEILIAKAREDAEAASAPSIPQLPAAPPKAIALPPEPPPFRFASWDDEEERR